MHYVYLLKANTTDFLYIGYTGDLRRRFALHREGKVPSTRSRRPLSLIYYEAYRSGKDARVRERRLKYFGKAYGQLKNRIAFSLHSRP